MQVQGTCPFFNSSVVLFCQGLVRSPQGLLHNFQLINNCRSQYEYIQQAILVMGYGPHIYKNLKSTFSEKPLHLLHSAACFRPFCNRKWIFFQLLYSQLSASCILEEVPCREQLTMYLAESKDLGRNIQTWVGTFLRNAICFQTDTWAVDVQKLRRRSRWRNKIVLKRIFSG